MINNYMFQNIKIEQYPSAGWSDIIIGIIYLLVYKIVQPRIHLHQITREYKYAFIVVEALKTKMNNLYKNHQQYTVFLLYIISQYISIYIDIQVSFIY